MVTQRQQVREDDTCKKAKLIRHLIEAVCETHAATMKNQVQQMSQVLFDIEIRNPAI